MSQRLAFMISTALTVLVLLAGAGLAVRAINASDDPSDDTTLSATASNDQASDGGLTDDQKNELIDQLQTSNETLARSYDRISSLLDQIDELEQQNATLREREEKYQQLLSQAQASGVVAAAP